MLHILELWNFWLTVFNETNISVKFCNLAILLLYECERERERVLAHCLHMLERSSNTWIWYVIKCINYLLKLDKSFTVLLINLQTFIYHNKKLWRVDQQRCIIIKKVRWWVSIIQKIQKRKYYDVEISNIKKAKLSCCLNERQIVCSRGFLHF